MNYQDCYYFIKVVEKGGLAAAAKKLDTPKSTLSRRLSSLEEELGYQLLHRTSRTFGLTDAGNKLFNRLRNQFNEIEFESQNVISELAGLTGELTVTAPLALGRQIVSKWVFEFMREHPNISVELLLSNEPIDLIKRGVDIAIRAGDLNMNDWIVRHLSPVTYSLVASEDFIKRVGKPNTLKEMDNYDTVVVSTSPLWRFEGPNGPVTFNPRRHFRSDVVTACLEAVLDDVGIGLLPHFMCEQYLQSGKMVRILPEYQATPKMLRMFYPRRDNMPAKNRAFIDYIVEKAKTFPVENLN